MDSGSFLVNKIEYPKFLNSNPVIWGLSLEVILAIAASMFISGNILKMDELGVIMVSASVFLVMSLYQKLFKKHAFYFFVKSKSELNWQHALRIIKKG